MWRVWVDTGGTFTDGLAVDPEGRRHRVKVLSSSALRGRLEAVRGARAMRYSATWRLPEGFATGAEVRWLDGTGGGGRIVACRGNERRFELDSVLPEKVAPGDPFEVRFPEEAPVLVARLLTATPEGRPLPPMVLRLATTRGTNALLERRGARTLLFVTRGFADLLAIGNQQRSDLFALDARRPEPLYAAVIEVAERLAADGGVLEPLDLSRHLPRLEELIAQGFETAAVALLHSYRNPAHEERLAAELERLGLGSVSVSSRLAPMVRILPRAETAVVDAYLAPIVGGYLERVESALGGGRLHVMTSAGGLVSSSSYRAKDSLLSGPAGGVVGAARSGRECGFERLIAFDMGGTSTDVSRFDGDYEYVFEHRVGDATVAAPALAIETVAAGGGSICHREGRQLKVGPQSAGADPGPACYGVGGPLTLTDVNLLLGRLDPRRFGIPIRTSAAAAAADALLHDLETEDAAREALLAGFLRIADERMADAIRRVSIRLGYDPRDYALVAFGGAGGQHACAVAGLLGIETVVAPRDAGLLSAVGLGAAVVERFAERQVLALLDDVEGDVPSQLVELARKAIDRVAREGTDCREIAVRRRLVFLRFLGQEATLELEVGERGDVGGTPLARAFRERYEALYGYRPPARPIELDSLRVVASSRPKEIVIGTEEGPPRDPPPAGTRRAYLAGAWRTVPVYLGSDLEPGDRLAGPTLVLDDHATLLLGPGWRARMAASRALVLSLLKPRRPR